jgi:hypothetical protein
MENMEFEDWRLNEFLNPVRSQGNASTTCYNKMETLLIIESDISELFFLFD